MKIISKDKFYNSGHTFSFYIKRLKNLGCPEDLIIMTKELMEAGYNDLNIQQTNTVTAEKESYILKYNDIEFYYYNSYGQQFFQRITINILNGYIDFGQGD